MNDIEMTLSEFSLYVIIGGAILGALVGLVPLILGRRKNRARLGFYGFLASIVTGALTGFFAIITAAIFSWIIAKGNSAPTNSAGGTVPGTNGPASE